MAYFRCGGGLPTQAKAVTATTSQQIVLPDDGNVLESVTVNPQSHSSYYPSASSYYDVDGYEQINLGNNHNYKYVRVHGTHELTETTLWTNPSPSSSFSKQNITLSQNMTNFKYLRIEYAPRPNSSYSSTAVSILVEVDSFFLNSTDYYTNYKSTPTLAAIAPTGVEVIRIVLRDCNYWSKGTDNPKIIGFANGYIDTGSFESDNWACVPLHIYGLK